MDDSRRFAPATTRNREPILEVLRRYVVPSADVLEIASGSGEHAVFLAPRLDVASWQPSDRDAESRASIDAWRTTARDPRVLAAIPLDVATHPWPDLATPPNVVMCVNMIHIAPWSACEGLLRGAAEVLRPRLSNRRILYLYGPYRRAGRHTAPSNEAFDAHLRSQNADWGVRDVEAVVELAEQRGFELLDLIEMPANNLSVLFTIT